MRVNHLFVIADYFLAAFLAVTALVFAMLLFALSSGPRGGEMPRLDSAYADVMHGMEKAGAGLRAGYCAGAEGEAAALGRCGDLEAADASRA